MRRTTESGFSLFEILIAIAVFSVVGVSVAQIIGVALQSDKTAGQKTVALESAQETMSAVNAIAAEQWNNIYGLPKGAGNLFYPANTAASCGSVKWCVKSGTATTTIDGLDYVRWFYVDNVSRTGTTTDAVYNSPDDDPSTQKVTVTVTWQATDTGNQWGSVSISNYFTRSRNTAATQSQWSTSGQAANPTNGETADFNGSYFTDDGHIDTTSPGNPIKLN